MTREELAGAVDELVAEYFMRGEYAPRDERGDYRRRTDAEFNEYRQRLKKFFAENDVPDDIKAKIRKSGMGESFYMSFGYGILSDN